MPNKRPARRNLLISAGVALLATAGVCSIQAYQAQSIRDRVRSRIESDDSFGAIRALSRSPKAADRQRASELRRDSDKWFAEVLARNPGLVPEWRPVPDAENGFLQLLDFAERHGDDIGQEQLELSDELSRLIGGQSGWNTGFAATALAGHRELIDEITRIGLLSARSSAGVSIDRYSFVGARLYKQCCDLLLADARLADETGDADRALLRVRAALGIADHLSKVETPSLLMETVALLVRLGVDRQVTEHILPNLTPDAATVAAWRGVLAVEDQDPSDFARVLRGEAYVSIRGLIIPLLVDDRNELTRREIPDPDAFLDAVATTLLDHSATIAQSTIGDLFGGKGVSQVSEAPSHLSPGASEAYEMVHVGANAWAKGWTRALSVHSQTNAALAIMAGEEPPPEPITGLPFAFDPDTRTLCHPDDPRLDHIQAEPITVP